MGSGHVVEDEDKLMDIEEFEQEARGWISSMPLDAGKDVESNTVLKITLADLFNSNSGFVWDKAWEECGNFGLQVEEEFFSSLCELLDLGADEGMQVAAQLATEGSYR